MWKQHYIVKNLTFFLIPLLIPVLILGSLSILITQHYVKDDINQKNMNLLIQTRDNFGLILNEMDTLSLNFQTSESVSVRLKEILRNNNRTYDQNVALELISGFAAAPANARPFIHSIYIYYDNPNRNLLTSTEGVAELGKFYDRSWFDSYTRGNPSDSWLEERSINRYGIENTRVISMYRKLYASGAATSTQIGVIVMNILPNYIAKNLQQLALSREQSILITDDDNKVLFQTNLNSNVPDTADLQTITASSQPMSTIQIGKQAYTASHLRSDRYGLHYISLIPRNVLYQVPIQLSQITFGLLLLSLLVGTAITYVLMRRNYANLKNIVSIIKSAEQGMPLPALPANVVDEYGFILQKIITTFIEQSYLKVQLSERSYRLRFMEMLALQSQINPHFLYNTLEIIYWKTMAISGRPNEASDMIEHLGDILRYALSSPNHTVLLQNEIRHTQIYLEIQKIRYKDIFEVVWDTDPDVERYEVPKLLLQPIIENSIYHGIKEKAGKSCIKIKIRSMPTHIGISVIDNGKGMSAARLREVCEKLNNEYPQKIEPEESEVQHPGSIGLYNTSKRLKLTYGDANGLRILSKPEWGTVVQIRIPV